MTGTGESLMSDENFGGLKQTVNFSSNGVNYAVVWLFDSQPDILFRAGAVSINLDATVDTITLEPLPHAMRVSINAGRIWFDTDDITASQIELMFEHASQCKNPK